MSIKFTGVKRKNIQKPQENEKFYAVATDRQSLDLDTIADLIADGSTIRRNDMYASLVGLVDILIKRLASGDIIKLGDLGSFCANISSNGANSLEELNSSYIKGVKIVFRPSALLKNSLKSFTYEKIKTKK